MKTAKSKWFLIFALILLVVAIMFLSYRSDPPNQPVAEKGIIDLTHWDYASNGPAQLNGEWEIYWNRLLHPEEFKQGLTFEGMDYFQVPNPWAGYSTKTQVLPKDGFATFRLIIKVDPSIHHYAIKLGRIDTAHKIWINGQLVSTSGIITISYKESSADARPKLVMFNNKSPTIEFIIHVSDYLWPKAGLVAPIKIGTANEMRHAWTLRTVFDISIAISVLVMAIFYLGLYSFAHKDKTAIYFGLFCLFISIRVLITGICFGATLIPVLGQFEINRGILATCLFLYLPAYFIYINRLFPDIANHRLERFSGLFGILTALLYWLVPAIHRWRFILPYLIVSAFILVYVFSRVSLSIIRKKKYEGIPTVIGLSLFLCILLIDVINLQNYIPFETYTEFGLLILVLIHTADQLKRFGNNLDRAVNISEENKAMTAKLQAYNARLEEQVRERTLEIYTSMKKAEQANKAKTTFLSNISHELRTPMQGILGFSNLGMIKVGELPDEKIQSYFAEIKESGSRLLSLLDDLLDLSRLESGKEKYSFDQTNLYTLIDYAQKELRTLLVTQNIQVKVIADSDEVVIQADPVKIIQVLINLLSNAIKYSPENTTVEIRLIMRDESVQLNITDEGVGIPEGELESIFDTFSQSSKTSNGAGGTGLGLAICRKIIADHGGFISASNNPEKGATFTLTLPKKQRSLGLDINN